MALTGLPLNAGEAARTGRLFDDDELNKKHEEGWVAMEIWRRTQDIANGRDGELVTADMIKMSLARTAAMREQGCDYLDYAAKVLSQQNESKGLCQRIWAASSLKKRIYALTVVSMFTLIIANHATESFPGSITKHYWVIVLDALLAVAKIIIFTLQYVTEHRWLYHVIAAAAGFAGAVGRAHLIAAVIPNSAISSGPDRYNTWGTGIFEALNCLLVLMAGERSQPTGILATLKSGGIELKEMHRNLLLDALIFSPVLYSERADAAVKQIRDEHADAVAAAEAQRNAMSGREGRGGENAERETRGAEDDSIV